jgi:hypothetical protein
MEHALRKLANVYASLAISEQNAKFLVRLIDTARIVQKSVVAKMEARVINSDNANAQLVYNLTMCIA